MPAGTAPPVRRGGRRSARRVFAAARGRGPRPGVPLAERGVPPTPRTRCPTGSPQRVGRQWPRSPPTGATSVQQVRPGVSRAQREVADRGLPALRVLVPLERVAGLVEGDRRGPAGTLRGDVVRGDQRIGRGVQEQRRRALVLPPCDGERVRHPRQAAQPVWSRCGRRRPDGRREPSRGHGAAQGRPDVEQRCHPDDPVDGRPSSRGAPTRRGRRRTSLQHDPLGAAGTAACARRRCGRRRPGRGSAAAGRSCRPPGSRRRGHATPAGRGGPCCGPIDCPCTWTTCTRATPSGSVPGTSCSRVQTSSDSAG